jgi:hypothetical protein
MISTITRPNAPKFSALPPVVRQTPPVFNHQTDSILFGQGQHAQAHPNDQETKNPEHAHVHGPTCNHAHSEATHETPDNGHAHGPNCNHSHSPSTQEPHQPSTGHVHANGEICHAHHDAVQHPVKTPPPAPSEKKGLSKALQAIKSWFSHFFETFKADMIALKDKIRAFFSKKTEPANP